MTRLFFGSCEPAPSTNSAGSRPLVKAGSAGPSLWQPSIFRPASLCRSSGHCCPALSGGYSQHAEQADCPGLWGEMRPSPESRFNARSSHAVSGSVSDPLPPKYNRRRLSACGGILCFRFICLWQRYDERRAFAHFAFYLDIPFHAHHHMLYNGKSQPGAAGGAAAPFIHTIKALEQP